MKNSNRRIAKLFFLLLTLYWTGIIFSFSLQPAVESSELSGGIVAWLVTVLEPVFGGIPNLEHWVRKFAHFCEYGLLGILATVTGWQFELQRTGRDGNTIKGLVVRWCFPWAYCILVAAIDETIQLFVPGRAGMVWDVLLDSAGALCGVVFVLIAQKILGKIVKFV